MRIVYAFERKCLNPKLYINIKLFSKISFEDILGHDIVVNACSVYFEEIVIPV